MTQIAIPYFSCNGHTLRLAKAIQEGIQPIINEVTLIDVTNMHEHSWQTLVMADGIIFGSPTFMGGIAGKYKLFLEEMAYRGYWQQQKLVNKMAAGFTVATYASGDKLNTLINLAIHAAQYGMIWVNNCGIGSKVANDPEQRNKDGAWLGLMATSIADKSKLIDASDIKTAISFGLRFAKAVKRWSQPPLPPVI